MKRDILSSAFLVGWLYKEWVAKLILPKIEKDGWLH